MLTVTGDTATKLATATNIFSLFSHISMLLQRYMRVYAGDYTPWALCRSIHETKWCPCFALKVETTTQGLHLINL